jgi:hypothetical protein
MGFANYTGEQAGYFYDPNHEAYFPVSGHAGHYVNWATGEAALGTQPVYRDPAQQLNYETAVRSGGLSVSQHDLARLGVPGAIDTARPEPALVAADVKPVLLYGAVALGLYFLFK